MTTGEVAAIIGRDRRTVCRMCDDGRLQARRDDSGNWLIWSESLPIELRRPTTDKPVPEPTWEVERSLLYAEHAELQLRLRDLELTSLRRELESLRIENQRMRAAMHALTTPSPEQNPLTPT